MACMGTLVGVRFGRRAVAHPVCVCEPLAAVTPAVVVRQRKPWRRKNGVFLYFEGAYVLELRRCCACVQCVPVVLSSLPRLTATCFGAQTTPVLS